MKAYLDRVGVLDALKQLPQSSMIQTDQTALIKRNEKDEQKSERRTQEREEVESGAMRTLTWYRTAATAAG